MIKVVITKVDKLRIQEDGSNQLSVTFDLMNGEEVVAERSLGFAYGTTLPEIKNELIKYAKSHKVEMENRDKNKEFEEQEEIADQAIEKLTGQEFSEEDEEEEIEVEDKDEEEE